MNQGSDAPIAELSGKRVDGGLVFSQVGELDPKRDGGFVFSQGGELDSHKLSASSTADKSKAEPSEQIQSGAFSARYILKDESLLKSNS